jgi:hypothetical protein
MSLANTAKSELPVPCVTGRQRGVRSAMLMVTLAFMLVLAADGSCVYQAGGYCSGGGGTWWTDCACDRYSCGNLCGPPQNVCYQQPCDTDPTPIAFCGSGLLAGDKVVRACIRGNMINAAGNCPCSAWWQCW